MLYLLILPASIYFIYELFKLLNKVHNDALELDKVELKNRLEIAKLKYEYKLHTAKENNYE